MDLELSGHVVLVVGGTGLIGSAVVASLKAEGAVPVVASRQVTEGLQLNAADDDSVSNAISQVIREHGRVHALVVTAAPSAGTLDPAHNSDPEHVLAAVEAKAMTFLRVANAVLPTMVEAGYGRIVGVSGQNAFLTGNIVGAVRNAALNVAAKNLADSVAGSGVTVNTVNPGAVTHDPSPDVQLAKGGDSTPEQVASLITYLASPLAAALSGESIAVGHRVRGTVTS